MKTNALVLAILLMSVPVWADEQAPAVPAPDMMQSPVKNQAQVKIKSMKAGAPDLGEGSVLELQDGVYFMLGLNGVPNPGKHGIHVYENGSCDAPGGHFNPDGVLHGNFKTDGPAGAHVGDLGNVEVNDAGEGALHRLLQGVTISGGKYNVEGKVIILDEKEDDFSQPDGNGGEKLGCGVIEVVKK